MIDANAPHSPTAKSCDPYPWAQSALGPGWFFDPRPEYSQNIEDYQ